MNESRKALRIYCKEFNKEEIINMSKEQKSKEELQASIAAKKVIFMYLFVYSYFLFCLINQSTLLHLNYLAKIQNELGIPIFRNVLYSNALKSKLIKLLMIEKKYKLENFCFLFFYFFMSNKN
jgi:hypothetical protein